MAASTWDYKDAKFKMTLLYAICASYINKNNVKMCVRGITCKENENKLNIWINNSNQKQQNEIQSVNINE